MGSQGSPTEGLIGDMKEHQSSPSPTGGTPDPPRLNKCCRHYQCFGSQRGAAPGRVFTRSRSLVNPAAADARERVGARVSGAVRKF